MRGIAVMTAVGLLTLPALAGAASQLTATNVRIGDHPAFVRVVVDFNGRVPVNEVELRKLTATMAVVRLAHGGVTSQTTGRTGNGVRVALQAGTQALQVTMTFAAHRFKYVSYAVVTGTRLAIDLWKSAPPRGATQTCRGLSMHVVSIKRGVVTVAGHERRIFENQFQAVVRGANGKVLGQRHVFGPGAWVAHVRYAAGHRQRATLEAVALSAKDGSIECLAQVRATIPAS